ncbi:uncharacterized protein LOC101239225 isoform X2 [Hydra vulgaris]|uniref:Uncharacterized protein LOC101239225 isoform X2 n=1 Tax=Hydra vulgaris TaxID=6087 RepID=A0ABM4BFL8_HYDVU
MFKKYASFDEEKGEIVALLKVDQDFDPENPFCEDFSNQFWEEVIKEYNVEQNGLNAAKAQRKIRLQYIQRSVPKKEDVVEYLLKDVPEKFKSYCASNKIKNTDIKFTNLVFEINEFINLILEEDWQKVNRERRYNKLLKLSLGSRRTILHLAADQDLDMVVNTIISFYPTLVNVTTEVDGFDDNPLCFALRKFYDKTSSSLINAMDSYSVRCLFESNEMANARFFFKDYINPKQNVSMKETVLAILEKLMNPYWPFKPVNEISKEIEWYDMPKAPLSHHFYFQILDADGNGNAPKYNNGEVNKNFNHRSKSCLHLIAESASCREAIQHPVVRLLVKRKWNEYGQNLIRIYAGLYLMFLVLFSLALFIQPENKGLRYNGSLDFFRLFCEVGTLLFVIFYIFLEVDEGEKSWLIYFRDFTNYIDILGLGTILLIVPFRFAEFPRTELVISSVAYILNCMRIFQYFLVFKDFHIYYRTFRIIIIEDIIKFAALFSVIVFGFTGSAYLALKASGDLQTVGGFWSVFSKEIRGLTQAQSFTDDYSNYNVVVSIFLMANMFFTMIILINILIGQISNRYTEAQSEAKIQYDIDKTKFITKMENSRICGRLRIRYYEEGGYATNSVEEDEVIADWVAMKEKESLNEENKIKFESLRGNIKLEKKKEE